MTFRGQRNVILGVQPPHVIVGTDRSPDGQRVDIVLHPMGAKARTRWSDTAFIGAVLLTLDGVTAGGSPPVVKLAPQGAMASVSPAAETATTPFTGALNHQVQDVGSPQVLDRVSVTAQCAVGFPRPTNQPLAQGTLLTPLRPLRAATLS